MRSLTQLARRLRKESTEAERLLWSYLRRKSLFGLKFRRQEQIGDYIVDFVCYEIKLIIELDGGHHNQDETRANDKRRQNWLESQNFQVIRFWNNEVLKNINGVLQVIKAKIPSP
ncbi:MAG TPA: endonuclease domain-containing protein [Ignavibacteriaceae bacterium]|nr:endonuclease domain-containing protein [Ignavibacteriaceae bacterium]